MLRAPEPFLREVFLPEYERMAHALHAHLIDLTKRVVADAIDADLSEPEEQAEEERLLPAAVAGAQGPHVK
jgi:hypothetical protein